MTQSDASLRWEDAPVKERKILKLKKNQPSQKQRLFHWLKDETLLTVRTTTTIFVRSKIIEFDTYTVTIIDYGFSIHLLYKNNIASISELYVEEVDVDHE